MWQKYANYYNWKFSVFKKRYHITRQTRTTRNILKDDFIKMVTQKQENQGSKEGNQEKTQMNKNQGYYTQDNEVMEIK